MPASRYLILLAGILGVLALFQPMMSLGRGPIKVQLSAYDLSFGLKKTHRALDLEIPALAKKHISPDLLSTRDDIKLVADASRGTALAYIPVALMLVLGVICVKRKRTGRGIGAIVGVLGLLSIAAWIGVRYAILYGIEEEPVLERLHFKAIFGAHVLLASGVIALAAAAKAFTKQDQ